MNQAQKIKRYWSENQVMVFLRGIKAATPATIVIRTEPKMNKFGRTRTTTGEKVPNPWLGRVYKLSKYQVFLNFDYEKSVNRQLAREDKEPEFKAAERTWGVKDGRCLVFYEGVWYLNCKLERKLDVEFRGVDDDALIDVSELGEFLPPVSHSVSQGTDKEVINLNPKLSNLVNMVAQGQDIIMIRS